MTHAPHITISAAGGPVGTPRATSPRLSHAEPLGFQPVRHPLPKLCARRPSLAVGAAFCRGSISGTGRSQTDPRLTGAIRRDSKPSATFFGVRGKWS